MATPAILATAEASVAFQTILSKIATKQAAHFAKYGKYLQLLWTSSVPPADGVTATPDTLAVLPANDGIWKSVPNGVDAKGNPVSKVVKEFFPTWFDLGVLPAKINARLACDEYDCGAKGCGYVVRIEIAVTTTGATWTRSIAYGPEAKERDVGWQKKGATP